MQIDASEVARTPLELPDRMASGETTHPGFDTWGTDVGVPGDGLLQRVVTALALGIMPPATFLGSPPSASIAWDQWIRFFVARDPAADALAVDPRHPGALRLRILELTRLQDVDEADLSAFRARGGKPLMARGAHDALVGPRATARYLTRLRDTMGAERVDDFVRCCEIPGHGRDRGRQRRRARPHAAAVRLAGPRAPCRGTRRRGGQLRLRSAVAPGIPTPGKALIRRAARATKLGPP